MAMSHNVQCLITYPLTLVTVIENEMSSHMENYARLIKSESDRT